MATNQLISTMAQPLMVFGGKMVFEAIDPTTGATVSGVEITNPVVSGINLSVVDDGGASALPDIEPLFTPVPVNEG